MSVQNFLRNFRIRFFNLKWKCGTFTIRKITKRYNVYLTEQQEIFLACIIFQTVNFILIFNACLYRIQKCILMETIGRIFWKYENLVYPVHTTEKQLNPFQVSEVPSRNISLLNCANNGNSPRNEAWLVIWSSIRLFRK